MKGNQQIRMVRCFGAKGLFWVWLKLQYEESYLFRADDRWLEKIAFSGLIRSRVFLVSGFTALLIALIMVSFQVVKAEIVNPVKSLRAD
jgi:putative ABC transport system permease protein